MIVFTLSKVPPARANRLNQELNAISMSKAMQDIMLPDAPCRCPRTRVYANVAAVNRRHDGANPSPA